MESQLPGCMTSSKDLLDGTYMFEGVPFSELSTPAMLEQLKTFEVREDDLIIADYPKCGLHWMREIVLLMKADGHVDRIKRDFDVLGALESVAVKNKERTIMEVLDSKPSPRLYLTNLPVQLLPLQVWTKKAKLIYLTRNPKDAWTSWYRFDRANPLDKTPMTWDQLFNNFIQGKALCGDFFEHSLGYWKRRDDDHVFFITYEQIKQDIRSVIRRLEPFLGLSVSPEGLERSVEHASVAGMKKTYDEIEKKYPENGKIYTRFYGLKPFVQTGVIGNWKEQFTEEQSEAVDQLIKSKLSGTGLDELWC